MANKTRKKNVAVKVKATVKWNLVPRSIAENSYQLLDEIVAAVHAEPKRVAMQAWLQLGGMPREEAPQCGTVGCIAGLIVATRLRRKRSPTVIRDGRVGHEAAGFFPPSLRIQAINMFTGNLREFEDLKPGSKKYAAAVVARIRSFQRVHAALLCLHQLTQ